MKRPGGTGVRQATEFVKRLNRSAALGRVPLSGTIELTKTCNLKCIHCYAASTGQPSDMPTALAMEIIDQLADSGCLFLVITGGEPMLRRDFTDIYSRARKRGIIVTVFTNGTTVDADKVALFCRIPPRSIEVSLYGATPAVCDSITGVRGSWERTMRGIRLLHNAGLPFRLKTVVMTSNRHEVDRMQEMAREFGVPFRLDACLFPRFNGDASPVRQRIPPADAARVELGDRKRLSAWRRYMKRVDSLPHSDALYHCACGLSSFNITSDGFLTPCLMMRHPAWDLSRGRFIDGWNGIISSVRTERAGTGYPCNTCGRQGTCNVCPAFSELEMGSTRSPSEYVCAVAHERYRILRKVV